MSPLNKSFFLGLAAGVAVTLASVNIGAIYVARRWWIAQHEGLTNAAVSLAQRTLLGNPKAYERLPRPWLPRSSNPSYDDWTIRPLHGKPTTLGEFKGKVVFLNFWRVSCGPCIVEMAAIQKLSNSLKNEPVAFLNRCARR